MISNNTRNNLKRQCELYDHKWEKKNISLKLPPIYICNRCKKIDAEHYNNYANENNLPVYEK